LYRWWVYLHIVGVFGFLIAHGVSIAVTFRLRTERDPRRVGHLLELSGSSISLFYASLFVLVLAGVVLGFLGDWWSQAWIWAALGILSLTALAMYYMARPYYRRVGFVARAMAGGSTAVSEEQFDAILRSRRPVTVAAIGFGALLLILYLMMFKPSLGLSAAPDVPAASCAPSGTALEISAEGNEFDKDCLAAPAGTPFSIELDNRDSGVPHNVSIYADSSASEPLFTGDLFPGPETRTYEVEAVDAGTYFFRCDAHPTQMTGAFVAAEEE
jgi:plastocyanin